MAIYEYREQGGHTEILDCSSLEKAVELGEKLLQDGDWGDPTDENYGGWVTATVVETDDEGNHVDSVSIAVLLTPKEPDCDHDHYEHEWSSEGEGGCDQNPGVWGIGGAAILVREHCIHCGVIREEITGDTNPPNCGNRNCVRYRWPYEEEGWL